MNFQNSFVYHLVMAILEELGPDFLLVIVGDFEPQYSIHDEGAYRLFDFHLEIRDDLNLGTFSDRLSDALARYGEVCTAAKPVYTSTEVYPGPRPNWSTVYVTVAIE